MKPITIQEISYDRNDKVKMTVKDKIKKTDTKLQVDQIKKKIEEMFIKPFFYLEINYF